MNAESEPDSSSRVLGAASLPGSKASSYEEQRSSTSRSSSSQDDCRCDAIGIEPRHRRVGSQAQARASAARATDWHKEPSLRQETLAGGQAGAFETSARGGGEFQPEPTAHNQQAAPARPQSDPEAGADWSNHSQPRNQQEPGQVELDAWRVLWRAARNYQQTDHYDYSLYGNSAELDRAVAQHQRQAMLYNQGEFGATSEPSRWSRADGLRLWCASPLG